MTGVSVAFIIRGMGDTSDRIRLARKDAKLTQAQLAEACGVHRAAVSQWEAREPEKRTVPKFENFQAIERKTGYSLHWLQTGGGLKKATPADTAQEKMGDSASDTSLVDTAARDVVQAPIMEAPGSMGRGVYAPERDVILDYMRLSLPWVRRNLAISNPGALRIITGRGDSMAPTFADGDPLLVDTGVTDLKIDAVYVLAREDELYIKRVQRHMDGTLVVRSDNPLYEPMIIASPEAAQIRVLGRIVWAWAGKQM